MFTQRQNLCKRGEASLLFVVAIFCKRYCLDSNGTVPGEMGEGKDISENGSGGNTAWEKKTRLQLGRKEKILFAGLSFF